MKNKKALVVGLINDKYSTYNLHANTKVIASYVFADCARLGKIVIPEGVVSIGSYAFKDCTKLTSVVIPTTVTNIGARAFAGCNNLKDGVCPTIAISYLTKTNLQSVKITSGSTIDSYAFYNCYNLTSVVISDSVVIIEEYAFYNCYNLTIYCQAEEKPAGWIDSWNGDNCPVVWGYSAN